VHRITATLHRLAALFDELAETFDLSAELAAQHSMRHGTHRAPAARQLEHYRAQRARDASVRARTNAQLLRQQASTAPSRRTPPEPDRVTRPG
jgi:hypothetical protein